MVSADAVQVWGWSARAQAGAEAIETAAKDAVAQGIEFAKAGPAPSINDVTKFVHAEEAA